MSWLHSLLLIVEFLWFNVVNFLGEPICQILEEQTGERVGSFGSRGQGPGEFIAAEFIGKTEGDDTLYFVNLPSTVLLYAREEKGADYRYVGSEKN